MFSQAAVIVYLNAQTAMMMVEMEGMKAENQQRAFCGQPMTYDDREFKALQERYPMLCDNAIVHAFREVQ